MSKLAKECIRCQAPPYQCHYIGDSARVVNGFSLEVSDETPSAIAVGSFLRIYSVLMDRILAQTVYSKGSERRQDTAMFRSCWRGLAEALTLSSLGSTEKAIVMPQLARGHSMACEQQSMGRDTPNTDKNSVTMSMRTWPSAGQNDPPVTCD